MGFVEYNFKKLQIVDRYYDYYIIIKIACKNGSCLLYWWSWTDNGWVHEHNYQLRCKEKICSLWCDNAKKLALLNLKYHKSCQGNAFMMKIISTNNSL